ncbi:transposase [Ahniella affigens]|uniref:Transposase n=1 Tax=Ahniella affigens TaxID=2021234 RepID=A0A2P1PNT3_9GAMM|nr:transposase [Ahniella affigens]AVP96499.1 transposase [Ahniella affigens]
MFAEVYSVAIYGYAVMINHVHVVLKIDADAAADWSDEELARRWCQAFPGSAEPESQTSRIANIAAAPELVAKYRDRLRDLSWFMKSLAEPIARQANKEDGCTGRFWEGRFKAQSLVDERALSAAMVYADLNPIRAKMTTDLPGSNHTSAQRRILQIKTQAPLAEQPLGVVAGIKQEGLSLSNQSYLTLANFTGRHWHQGKPGRTSDGVRLILEALKIAPEQWDQQLRGFDERRVTALGALDRLIQFATETGRRWLIGYQLARKAYHTAMAL